ncbi:hypothetical protein [Streptomyces sp. NPDC003952]
MPSTVRLLILILITTLPGRGREQIEAYERLAPAVRAEDDPYRPEPARQAPCAPPAASSQTTDGWFWPRAGRPVDAGGGRRQP